MCDLDVIGTPSKLNVIRKPVVSESQDNPSFEVLSERHTTVVGRVDVVCYSSIKRELKTRSIYECRCDERPKPKGEESTCLAYTFLFIINRESESYILGFLEVFFFLGCKGCRT